MKNFLSYFYGRSLRFQLLFWFLFISLLPLTWMAYITYHTSKDIILKETEEHLQVTGLKQIRLLNTFFAEKERSVAALVRELISPQLENALELAITQKGKDSKEYLQLVNELKKRLKNSPNFRDYQNFILVDEQTLFEFYDKKIPKEINNRAAFIKWYKTQKQKDKEWLENFKKYEK